MTFKVTKGQVELQTLWTALINIAGGGRKDVWPCKNFKSTYNTFRVYKTQPNEANRSFVRVRFKSRVQTYIRVRPTLFRYSKFFPWITTGDLFCTSGAGAPRAPDAKTIKLDSFILSISILKKDFDLGQNKFRK